MLAGAEKHVTHGISEVEFFEQVGLALDVYSNYDKFLLARKH